MLSIYNDGPKKWRPLVQRLVPNADDSNRDAIHALIGKAVIWAREHNIERSTSHGTDRPKTVDELTNQYMRTVQNGYPVIPAFVRSYCAEELDITTKEGSAFRPEAERMPVQTSAPANC